MADLVTLNIEQPTIPALPAARPSDALTVIDHESYEAGVAMVAETKAIWKRLDEKRSALKAGALKACRDIDAFFAPPLRYYAEEEAAIKAKLLAFRAVAEEAARRARVAAEKAAAEERAKLEAEAMKAAKTGDVDKAEELLERAEVTAAAWVDPDLNAGGASQRHKWVVTIADKAAFIKAALKNGYIGLLDIDTAHIGRIAQARGSDPKLPGISCVKEAVLVVRGRATADTF